MLPHQLSEFPHFGLLKMGLITPSNAAPEWQAGSVRMRSRQPVVACPLERLVRLPHAALEEIDRGELPLLAI